MLLVVVAVVVLALAGGGWMFMSKKHAAGDDDEDEAPAAQHSAPSAGPPTYLPLDNMVVNLADPGGERVAQVGVTFELGGQLDIDKVKGYLPTIRSEILMLVSQRTAEELLKREGKEQLAADILAEASKHFVDEEPPTKKGGKKKKKPKVESPIHGVLFSNLIVQ